MCMIDVRDMIYISLFVKKAACKVTFLYLSPPHLAGFNAAVVWVHVLARVRTNIPESLHHPLKHHRDSSEYRFTDHSLTMVKTRWEHVKCKICKKKLFNEHRLEAHDHKYHPILMNPG